MRGGNVMDPPMRLLVLVWACVGLACSGGQKAASVDSNGDLFITHARFLDAPPGSDALLVRAGNIVAVGTEAGLKPQVPANARVLDAKGGYVLPGFHDAHLHMLGAGMMRNAVDLSEAATMDEAQKKLAAFAKAHPDVPFIEGRGFQYGLTAPNTFPTRQQLDAAVPDRPAFIRSYDGHSGWANTKALERAGITAETKDPEGGRIVRDADGKSPQGTLLEGAQFLMMGAVPKPTEKDKRAALKAAADDLVKLGVTSAQEIAFDPTEFALFDALHAAGELPLRVTVSLPLDGDLAAYARARDAHQGAHVGFGFLKGFVDGVIESRTAFMLRPYEGTTDDKGKPMMEESRLKALVLQAHAAGFGVALHAIGDAAVRLSLDAYEAAQKAHPAVKVVHRVEHIEVVDPADVPRFKALGVIASMQPFHANPGGPTPDDGVWSKNLGPARLPNTFAWRTLKDAGATLAFGSDWPVMSANPLWGLAMATSRKDPNGQPPNGWNAHQAVTVAQAVEAYSVGSATAVGRGDRVGRLAAGQWGDVVVLNPSVDPNQTATLWKGAVAATVVGGVVRYQVP